MHEKQITRAKSTTSLGTSLCLCHSSHSIGFSILDGSSVNDFSVFADKPVVFIRELLIDSAPSLDEVAALCPQLTNELGESFPVISSLHGHQGILLRDFWISRGHLNQDA